MKQPPDLDPVAARGFSAQAALYAATRPGYPRECLKWLRYDLNLRPGTKVLEVGAGTGKFTSLLLEVGADVIAVEPLTEMRAHLVSAFPGVRALSDTAQKLSLPDSSIDAIVCAQSFHWFCTAETVAEFHRVLKPGGRVGIVCNQRDEGVEWVARLSKLVEPYRAKRPANADPQSLFTAAGFSTQSESQAPNDHKGPAEVVVVEATRTRSFVAALPQKEQSSLLIQVRALVESTPKLAGKTEVCFPYTTRMLTFTKLKDSANQTHPL